MKHSSKSLINRANLKDYIGRYIICILLLIPIYIANIMANPIINMNIIKQIESSNNPKAYNKTTEAKGLYQITPICLKEYNNFHKKDYTSSDLFDAKINTKIAKWYLQKRIPQMLKYYNKKITVKNILISYNAGIKYVVDNLELPKETKNYIKKYNKEVGR